MGRAKKLYLGELNMKSFKKVNSAGFSLIELLLVIGFIAGALVLAFVTYPKVQATNRANVESQHITVIAGGIKNLYATAQNFTSLNESVLINSKVIPDDLQVSGNAINNIWGGSINIGPVGAGPLALKYNITYSGVPRSECTKLATSVAVNFLALSINGKTEFDRTAANGGGNLTLDPAAVSTDCVDGSTNTLIFTGN